MKTLIPTFLSFLALHAAASAQQQEPAPAPAPATSEAEKLFRDAWWAESGKNDLETALRGYLAAAAAEGPASVRAKALLHAAGAQQRLGKADAALDLYKKVIAEHATERACVEQARVHLRELTAVDLRQNYDEWYERRLFGEEIQLLILGKLEALTSLLAQGWPQESKEQQTHRKQIDVLEAEIRAFGKGAVPALHKACSGGHDASREHAIDMLFSLGELPPVSALLSCDGWLGDAQHWALLLANPSTAALPASSAWHRPLLAAARQGPAQLLAAMLASRDRHLVEGDIVTHITTALLQHDASRDATVAAIGSEETPHVFRLAMEAALCESGEALRLSAQQWLQVSEDPLSFGVRIAGTRHAANLLGKGDEAILESLLQRAETARQGIGLTDLTEMLGLGLGRRVAPLDVPWTAARLRRLMLIGQHKVSLNLVEILSPLHANTRTRAMLTEALFSEPAAFVAAIRSIPDADRLENPLVDQVAFPNGGERENALFCPRWHAAMLAVLEREWSKWNDANRAAAVWIVQQTMRTEGSFDAVRTFLDGKKAGAAEPVRTAIEALFAKLAG
ncbi:MAG TPA: hypothetical protein VFD82_24360 [Planctomycetota bacterium]|nr:hypothetical protein [Planctomycetota bacterium]